MSNEHDGAGMSPETFQEIISERRVETKEKAEQKRVDDLRRIQEMKSAEGVHPLEIFPQEIWELLFHNLNPEDRANIFPLHDVFQDVMENSHVRNNLLPQILKFETESFRKVRRFNARKIAPAPLAHYFNLRSVSKCLRNEVDRFLEEDLLGRLRHGDSTSQPRMTTRLWISDNEDSNMHLVMLDRLLADIKANSKLSPRIISRSVTIHLDLHFMYDGYPEVFEEFVKKITNFLEYIGSQLWHFHLACVEFSNDNRTGRKLSLPLDKWFSLMPNLKWLQVKMSCFKSLSNCFDVEALQSQKLPILNNLERIDFHLETFFSKENNKNEIKGICKVILEANSHIKILHMQGMHANSIPSLEGPQLETYGRHFGQYKGRWFKFEMEKPMINLKWPLKRLVLRIDMENDSIIPAFELVQNFPTLEQLSLTIKNAVIGGDMTFLRLLQLKNFELEIAETKVDSNEAMYFFFSLQFLIHSKSLKTLKWSYQPRELEGLLKELLEKRKMSGGIVEFGGGWEDLTKSNLWKVFPYLEYVSVTANDVEKIGSNPKPNVTEYHRNGLLQK